MKINYVKALLVAFIFGGSALAQTSQKAATGENKPPKFLSGWNVWAQGGLTSFDGEIRSINYSPFNGFKKDSRDWGYYGSLALSKPISHLWSFMGEVMYGKLQGTRENIRIPGQNQRGAYFNTNITEFSVSGIINLNNANFMPTWIRNNRKINYYLKGGIGLVRFDSQVFALADNKPLTAYRNGVSGPTTEQFFLGGGGVRYRITNAFFLGIEGTYRFTNTDKLDAYVQTERKDNYGTMGLTASFLLGAKKNPEPLEWKNPWEIMYTDVQDTKKRITDATTDSDGDGIADIFDQEPNTPAGATVDSKGKTLDSDGDGVPDYLDEEPFSAPGAKVDKKGRKIWDENDPLNPNSKNYISNPDNVAKIFGPNGILNGGGGSGKGMGKWYFPIIFFDLDKHNIRPDAMPGLHQVAAVMNQYPDMKIEVVGHTDVRLGEKYNEKLGERRANAAVDHLVNNYGINRARFIIKTEGKVNNLYRGARNENAHQINRRVEFKVAQ